eukprot:11809935-Alexandrium_andersonii.AAC.1
MSASLVGSEMCIRDRRWAPPAPRPRLLKRSNHLRQKTTNPRKTAMSRCPVSYTHLTLPTICSV